MPELPEVETIARGLNRKLKNRKIMGLWTDWPKFFKLPKGEAAFRKDIIGKRILSVGRRGKNVLFELSDSHLLLIHQKMSGHLLVGKWQRANRKSPINEVWAGQQWIPVMSGKSPLWDPMNRFIRFIFFLDNGLMLALSDLRRFAKILCGPEAVIFDLPELKKLGPEPLDKDFGYKIFHQLFYPLAGKKKDRIKQVLLDQNFISGIGNIYSDEILWFSKIHPLRKIETLKEKDLKLLYRAIKSVLRRALKFRGSSVDDYRDAEGRQGIYDKVRKVYQREGEPCFRCRTPIRRLKINNRSAHFCPQCQKS